MPPESTAIAHDRAISTSRLIADLETAIEDVWAIAVECELDYRTHGPDEKKNSATAHHSYVFQRRAEFTIALLRQARSAVDEQPTVANQSALLHAVKAFQRLVARFEHSFPDALTTQPGASSHDHPIQ